MRIFGRLLADRRGSAGARVLLIAALVAVPALNPGKTGAVLRDAQSNWESIWTIDVLATRGA